MAVEEKAPSARRGELLEAAYRYVLERGLVDLSLRPLAAAVGSSPRVLLFLFGSKAGLVEAILGRARADELDALERVRARPDAAARDTVTATWEWLASPQHRPLLVLWLEAYGRSLVEPAGPWGGFAARTVADWLGVLAPSGDEVDATLRLAVLRGAMLDVLATGDVRRTTEAVRRFLA